MPYESLEALPQEVKEQLPQSAQQIFLAAFNSATSDGLNEEAARSTAWNSVKNSYRQDSDGQWHHYAEGGTGDSRTGTMPYA